MEPDWSVVKCPPTPPTSFVVNFGLKFLFWGESRPAPISEFHFAHHFPMLWSKIASRPVFGLGWTPFGEDCGPPGGQHGSNLLASIFPRAKDFCQPEMFRKVKTHVLDSSLPSTRPIYPKSIERINKEIQSINDFERGETKGKGKPGVGVLNFFQKKENSFQNKMSFQNRRETPKILENGAGVGKNKNKCPPPTSPPPPPKLFSPIKPCLGGGVP